MQLSPPLPLAPPVRVAFWDDLILRSASVLQRTRGHITLVRDSKNDLELFRVGLQIKCFSVTYYCLLEERSVTVWRMLKMKKRNERTLCFQGTI